MCIFEQKWLKNYNFPPTVTVNGSINLPVEPYYKCLEANNTLKFKECNNEVLKEVKTN